MTASTQQKENPDVLEKRERARQLYFQGWRVSVIARELGVKSPTVYSWKDRDGWERASSVEKIEQTLEVDICRLLAMPERTRKDEQRLDANFRHLEKLAKIKQYEASGGSGKVLNPKLSNRGDKKNAVKNYLDDEDVEKLKAWFADTFLKWGYQKRWYEARLKYQIRNILKSRQIGATYYFAHEALLDALETGDNQVFLSASKMQAHIFRSYIQQTVHEVCGVELKGEHLQLHNGATLYFLATNKRSAQGYHGHLYLDEYFWIHGFEEFQRVTSGMAIQSKWRETYFSTPSSMAHEAYPFWTGDHYNVGRPKSEHISLDLSHTALVAGLLCADGHWRNMVTVLDAVADGCDLFDIEKLRQKYPPDTFNNLLMCKFIDDSASAFNFSEIKRGMVDSWVKWGAEYTPLAKRPFNHKAVWVGYDPSRSRDDAAFVVLAPPDVPGGKFRLLEKHSWNNLPFEEQVNRIFAICDKYNVEYFGVDTSGIGGPVFESIIKKYPAATAINFSVAVKERLVMKAQAIFRQQRFEFDQSLVDVVTSFTSIKKVSTGKQLTYDAGRSSATGHADVAWAIMLALDNEDITAALPQDLETGNTSQSFMESV